MFFTKWGRRCALPVLLGLAMAGATTARGGDSRVGLLVRTIDQQYFTTPFERAAILGGAYMGDLGSAASTIRNPAALAAVCGPDALGYWVADSIKGEASLTPTPGDATQRTRAFLSDQGAYVAMPLGGLPISAGFGGNYFSTGFSGDPEISPAQRGTRMSAALAAPIHGNVNLGYGATWFNDHYATAAEFDMGRQMPHTSRLSNESHSWRHRLALFAPLGHHIRWGLQGDYGYGAGTTRLDGEPLTGRNAFENYALRGGFQCDVSHRITAAVDVEWSYLDLNMGEVPPDGEEIIPLEAAADRIRYAANVYRPMVGLQFRATPRLTLRTGYRHTFYRFRQSPLLPGSSDYGTLGSGARYSFWGGRAAVDWNIEYSWIADHSLLNTLTLSCMF